MFLHYRQMNHQNKEDNMCRNRHNIHGVDASDELTVNSDSQASFPPMRTMTQPTVPTERPRKVIDTKNLNEQDLKNLKSSDPFLYYSIPFVRDAEVVNKEFQIPIQDGSQPSTNTKVERKSRISYECHPDLLLDGLLDGDLVGQECSLEHEDFAFDSILQLMMITNDERRQRQ
mmetsp:Transcript_4133/g.7193  ORF Transcript_4133/g.7193 Transcript_4133/m.7193 type:complete len:173 (+) Transcript_4133:66-584(+)